MKQKLEDLAGDLRHRSQALLARYDAEDLHQLRVGLRRMRSFLEPRKGGGASRLRHELGKLADTTNAARDWDTLVARAYDDLGPRQVTLFEADLRRRQDESHEPVLQMLRSPEWTAAVASWDKYLKKHPPRHHGTAQGGKSIARARTRVGLTWQQADRAGEPRHWHKLRIAIKELRYRLEEQPGGAESADGTAILAQCKRLQSCLGDWHDTVVHRQLVRELAHTYDPGSESGELKVLRNWGRKLEQRGQRCLAATRSLLATGASAILPD